MSQYHSKDHRKLLMVLKFQVGFLIFVCSAQWSACKPKMLVWLLNVENILKIAQLLLELVSSNGFLNIFYVHYDVQRTPYDLNASTCIKILIHPYNSDCLNYFIQVVFDLCVCFFVVAQLSIFGMEPISPTSARGTSISVAVLLWERSKLSLRHKVECGIWISKAWQNILPLSAMEGSCSSRKCHQN